jgi:hypothetical protein
VIEQSALAHAGRLRNGIQRQTRGAHFNDDSLGGFEHTLARRTNTGVICGHDANTLEFAGSHEDCTGWTVL